MKFYTLFLLVLVYTSMYGQVDRIEVDFIQGKPYYVYQVTTANTIYQWSQLLDLPAASILQQNGLSNAQQVQQGQNLRLKCDLDQLFRGVSIAGKKDTRMTPVIYKVKPKEGLYRIAKVYCQEDITTMMKRNKLTDMNLSIGQELIIGWRPTHSDKPIQYTKVEKLKEEANEEYTSNTTLVRLDDDEFAADTSAMMEHINYTKQKGIAIWSKSSKGHAMFVLHPTAKMNSEITLYNPTVNRSVKAKVIGRIPKDTYTSDVSVIISPATAVNLGALDTRFQVEMTYIQ